MVFTSYSGILNPADLEIIQKVFDQLCEERRLAQKDRDQREEFAAEIIYAFQHGTTSEADLKGLLSERRHRHSAVELPEGRSEPGGAHLVTS